MKTVWLLEVRYKRPGAEWKPYLIFNSRQDILEFSKQIVWDTTDDDFVTGEYPDLADYLATEWPVHGSE